MLSDSGGSGFLSQFSSCQWRLSSPGARAAQPHSAPEGADEVSLVRSESLASQRSRPRRARWTRQLLLAAGGRCRWHRDLPLAMGPSLSRVKHRGCRRAVGARPAAQRHSIFLKRCDPRWSDSLPSHPPPRATQVFCTRSGMLVLLPQWRPWRGQAARSSRPSSSSARTEARLWTTSMALSALAVTFGARSRSLATTVSGVRAQVIPRRRHSSRTVRASRISRSATPPCCSARGSTTSLWT